MTIAQNTFIVTLKQEVGPETNWKGVTIFIKHHRYIISLGDGNEDGIIKYNGQDYFNLKDDSTDQRIAMRIKTNPILVKLEEYNECWSFRILDDTGKHIEYGKTECNTSINGILINKIPSIKVHSLISGKIVSLDTVARLNNSEKMVLVHFLSTSCAPCISEMSLNKELIKRKIKIIYFADENSDKSQVKSLFAKYKIKDDVYIGGNDDIGKIFNQSGFPFSILFIKNLNPKYFYSYEEVLDYLHDHEELVK